MVFLRAILHKNVPVYYATKRRRIWQVMIMISGLSAVAPAV
jgi:hypothetical protein